MGSTLLFNIKNNMPISVGFLYLIRLVNRDLFSTYERATVLGAYRVSVNKIGKEPCLLELTSQSPLKNVAEMAGNRERKTR